MRRADQRSTTPATALLCLVAAVAVLLMGAANLSSLGTTAAPALPEVHELVGGAPAGDGAAVDELGVAIRTAAAGLVLLVAVAGLVAPAVAAQPCRRRALAVVPSSGELRRAPCGLRAPPS